MFVTLLTTKLHTPFPTHNLVERPHLLERLNEGTERKLTLVCAPAGFGKTTAVTQWIRDCASHPVAWLSLDEADNELRRFTSYLVAALQQADPHVGVTTQTLLKSSQMITVEQLLTPLINDLSQLDKPINFVLDDYHLISDQSIHNTLTFLIEHQPQQLHLVITSRNDPPLPLGRLRARAQVIEIRSNDLSFDHDAIVVFFRELMGIDLSESDTSLLSARTEGWVAGLQLAGLALQEHDNISEFINQFAGDHTYLVDYLGEEVFKQQPDDVRDFLLKTAILSRLSPGLCDAVTEHKNGRALLNQLYQANLFLIPLDDRREWYRYHHLFSDLLLHFLQQMYPDQISVLHQLASVWYEQNDLLDDAVHHALLGEHYQRAADLIETVALDLIGQSRLNIVFEWIDRLPISVIESRPYLPLYQAWAASFTPQRDLARIDKLLAKSRRILADANHCKEQDRANISGQISLLMSYSAIRHNDPPTAIKLLHQALELIPEQASMPICVANSALGHSHWQKAEFDLAETHLHSALSLASPQVPGTTYPSGSATGTLVDVYLQVGKLRKALAVCEQALANGLYKHRDQEIAILGFTYTRLGKIQYEYNQIDATLIALNKGIEMAELMGQPELLGNLFTTLALTHHRLGNQDKAQDYAQRAINIALKANAYLTLNVFERLTRLCIEEQNPDHLTDLSKQVETLVQNAVPWHERGELGLARTYMSQKQSHAALDLATRSIDSSRMCGAIFWVVKGLVLRSLICNQLRMKEDALLTIAQALSLAEPEGYIRTFVDEGVALADLLSDLIANYRNYSDKFVFSAKYVSQLLAIIDEESQNNRLYEQLTKRELDVLRLLAAGLSNQDIAEKLFITLGTVKQYNHVIFRKLDVRTRNQTVQRATDLNLL